MNLNNSRLLKKIMYYNHTLFCTVLGEMNGFYVYGSLMITMSFDLNKNCTACAKFLCQPCG